MAALPAFPAVLIHQVAMHIWTDCIVFSTVKRENCSFSADTTVLFHYIAMDKWTDCSVVSTG